MSICPCASYGRCSSLFKTSGRHYQRLLWWSISSSSTCFRPESSSVDASSTSRQTARKNKHKKYKFDLFVSCLPGLEPLLASELRCLNATSNSSSNLNVVPGGVETSTNSVTTLLQQHLWLGTATHVLWRCGKPFYARGFAELERKVSKHFAENNELWAQVVLAESTIELKQIRVSASKSKLCHTGAIAERIKNCVDRARSDRGIIDQNTTSTDEESHRLLLVVRVHRDLVQISIDTSPTPLHQRGYRLQTAKAPLREDLAFALLYAAGWSTATSSNSLCEDTDVPAFKSLWDPFCGSGTIAIEAAVMVAGLPPGRLRSPPLVGTSMYSADVWQSLKETAIEASHKTQEKKITIFASDRVSGGVKAARANAKRAGVEDHIKFEVGAISSMPSVTYSNLLIATNPPYGKRLSNNDLLSLYRTLGNRIRYDANGCGAVMVQDLNLIRRTGLNVRVAFTSPHGGTPVSAAMCSNQESK